MTRIKIIIFLSLFLFTLTSINAQENYFNFKTGSWASILKKAKNSQKTIFIQTYSKDCDACRRIANETWTDKELGELYAKSFILYKIDLNSKAAKSLKKELGINANPTSIFVDMYGQVIHKYVGFVSVSVMRDMARRVNSGREILVKYNSMFSTGVGDFGADELLDYANVLLNAGENTKDVADAYFGTQSREMLSESYNIEAMLKFTDDINSREFDVMARRDFSKEIDPKYYDQIMLKVEDIISLSITNYLINNPHHELLMDTLERVIEYYHIENQDYLISRLELDYLDYVEPNPNDYFIKLVDYMNLHLAFLSPQEIGDKCQRVVDECSIAAIDNESINWMMEAIARDSEDMDLQMTFIDVLVKNKHFDEAKELAEQVYMRKYGESEYGTKKLEEFYKKLAKMELQQGQESR